MWDFDFKNFRTGGVNLRAAVKGDGPLIILVHGWPELWYSWRHQIAPLSKAGYRVIAPDMRGYGGSDKPHPVEAYDMQSLMADIIGIIDAEGQSDAILVGHDWGAPICWNTAALFPDRIRAVACLSVPYRGRAPIPAIKILRKIYQGKFFYQLYFQEPGVAEAEFEADVRTALRKIYFSISGDGFTPGDWAGRDPSDNFLDGLTDPDPLPSWLSEDDIDYFNQSFEAGGFRGPLNRYRNYERDFETLPEMGLARIKQPSCLIAGEKDVVRHFVPGKDGYENPGELCDDFRFFEIIDGVGHWTQQEAPEEVNHLLLKFLSGL